MWYLLTFLFFVMNLELMSCCWSTLQTTTSVRGFKDLNRKKMFGSNVFSLVSYFICDWCWNNVKTMSSCWHVSPAVIKRWRWRRPPVKTNTEGKQRHLVGSLTQWSWTASSTSISQFACLISDVDVFLNTQSYIIYDSTSYTWYL